MKLDVCEGAMKNERCDFAEEKEREERRRNGKGERRNKRIKKEDLLLSSLPSPFSSAILSFFIVPSQVLHFTTSHSQTTWSVIY